MGFGDVVDLNAWGKTWTPKVGFQVLHACAEPVSEVGQRQTATNNEDGGSRLPEP